MSVKISDSWIKHLDKELQKDYFFEIIKNVKHEYSNYKCFPKGNDIFKAFDLCSFEKIKVIIVGQDPYHGDNQANGLCFSVNKGVMIPPSLKNIYKEIQDDVGDCVYNLGNLEQWAAQGVLLLNSSLTVNKSEAGSHKSIGWNILIDSIIDLLNVKGGVIFLLWGRDAQEKEKLIDKNVNHIFKSSHPSPLSSYRGFFGCKHFSSTNELLIKNKKQPILW